MNRFSLATLLGFYLIFTSIHFAIAQETLSPQDSHIRWQGRTQNLPNGDVRFSYPGVYMQLNFMGDYLAIEASSSSGNNYLSVQIDQQPEQIIQLPAAAKSIEILRGPRQQHKITILNRNETWQGQVTFSKINLSGKLLPAPKAAKRQLMIVGDSVSCGEAIERSQICKKDPSWWNPKKTYGFLMAEQLNAEVQLICYGGRGIVRSWNGKTDEYKIPDIVNFAIPTDQNPVLWDHKRYQPDVILINAGTNDFGLNLADTPTEDDYVARYSDFLKTLRKNYPHSKILLTEGPIVNNDLPARPQKTLLQSYLAKTLGNLEDPKIRYAAAKAYGGDACDGHPTAQQHALMAADFLPAVRDIAHWQN